MKELSLIIPVYNAEPFLAGTIDRVRDFLRAFPANEVIFVDDGSIDSTRVILEEHHGTEPTYQYISVSENHGKGYDGYSPKNKKNGTYYRRLLCKGNF